MAKIKNIFLILALFFLVGITGAQTKSSTISTVAGNYPHWYFTDIDSAESQTGARFDAGLWISKPIDFYVYYNGGSNDSLQVILMGSPTPVNTINLPSGSSITSVLYDFPLDTIFVKSDTKYGPLTASLTAKASFIYPKIIPYNSDGTTNDGDVTDDGTFEFAVWAEDNITIPPIQSFQAGKKY